MKIDKNDINTEQLTVTETSGNQKRVRAARRSELEITRKGTQKKYIVSSVVEGAPINNSFLEAMELYADRNNAELILLWMRGVYKGDHFSLSELDKIRKYLTSEIRFNTKLIAKAFLASPE